MTFWCSNNQFSKVKQEVGNQTKLNLATIFSYVPQLKHQMNACFSFVRTELISEKSGALVTQGKSDGEKKTFVSK